MNKFSFVVFVLCGKQVLSASFASRDVAFIPRGGDANDAKSKNEYGNNYDDVIGGNSYDEIIGASDDGIDDGKYSASDNDVGESEDDSENQNVNVEKSASDNAVQEQEPSKFTTSKLIGVIDLRPTPEPDSIILVNAKITTNEKNQSPAIRAIFPSVDQKSADDTDDDLGPDEEMMDQQAAASHSIGSLCSKIYLVISYDYENGKAVLHGSLGGLKLMNFMDGLRNRWDSADVDSVTKLVFLLVPSSTPGALSLLSCLPEDNDETSEFNLSTSTKIVVELKNHENLNVSGADFLLDRLKSYFAMGGEKYQQSDPFAEVEMLGVWESKQKKGDDVRDDNMKQVVLDHSRLSDDKVGENWTGTQESQSERKCILDMIKDAYESAGGNGGLLFE